MALGNIHAHSKVGGGILILSRTTQLYISSTILLYLKLSLSDPMMYLEGWKLILFQLI